MLLDLEAFQSRSSSSNKMKVLLMVCSAVIVDGVIGDQAPNKKEKRGVGFDGVQGSPLDSFNVPGNIGLPLWNLETLAPPIWNPSSTRDIVLENIQFAVPHANLAIQNFQTLRDPGSLVQSVAYSPEVLRAIQFAKEANRQVHLAQQRVNEAKQAAIIQQNIAITRETAAREAAQRSAEIVSQADAEARMSAQQLVEVQRRLAALKDSVAAAQRLAAARENAAAAAIQRSAADTAAQLRKQDVERQISQTEREAKVKDLASTRDTTIYFRNTAAPHSLKNDAGHKQEELFHPWG